MAEPIVLPGNGFPVLVDDVTDPDLGTGAVQIMKLMSGATDSVERISGTAANGLDVDVTRILDGADEAQGATTDAAAFGNVDGTVSARLRALLTIFDSVWDSGNGKLFVDTGGSGSTDPKTSFDTEVAVAAGASVDLDSDQISAGKTGFLTGIIVSSSVPFKAVVQTVLNGVATTVSAPRIVTEGGWDFVPPGSNYITAVHDATAGFDGFRVVFTSLDTSAASDAHATFFWSEV